MNGTFVSVDGNGVEVRYNVGIRNRGNGCRRANPNNYRVNFANDRPLNGVTGLNLNSQWGYRQHIGHTLIAWPGWWAKTPSRPRSASTAESGPNR